MEKFNYYLPQALAAANKKFPGETFQFYNGQYQPDIDNFHYEYNFASSNIGVKVVVNTFTGGTNFIVMQLPNHNFTGILVPVPMPVDYTLMQAYDLAISRGYKPNLFEAIVFLQNPERLLKNTTGSVQGPAYWFLDGSSNTEWILVGVNEPHAIMVTNKEAPYIPD